MIFFHKVIVLPQLDKILDEIKAFLMNILDVFMKGIGFVGNFPDLVYIRTLEPEEASELVYLSDIRGKKSKIPFLAYDGYMEIQKTGSRENLILNIYYRFREKIDTYARVATIKGKVTSKKVSGEVYHVFHLRIDLHNCLLVFGYGIHSGFMTEPDPYRPLRDIYKILTTLGFAEYERSEVGFLYNLNANLDHFVELIAQPLRTLGV